MYRENNEFFQMGMVFGPFIWFYIFLFIIFVTLLTVWKDKVSLPRVCHFGMMIFVASLVVPIFGMALGNIWSGVAGSTGLAKSGDPGSFFQTVIMISLFSAPFLLGVSLLLLGISLRPKWENPNAKKVRVETETEKPIPVVNPFD